MLGRQEPARARPGAIAAHPGRQFVADRQRSVVQESDRYVSHGHREVFDRELQRVRADVVRMGELAAIAIDGALDALSRQDLQAAAAIVRNDAQINEAQDKLTSLIVTTIATQAPVAGDLLFLLSLSHVTYELERIGDHAAGVARQVARLSESRAEGRIAVGTGLDLIGELAKSTLHGILRALVDLDPDAARAVAAQDDEIDRLYHAYFDHTLERMRKEPDWVQVGAHLLFAAKDLERIGDRVTNIAEEVVFLSTGDVEDLNP
jgi:phosphate transport system protein